MEDETLLLVGAGAVALLVLSKPLQDIGGDVHAATGGLASGFSQTVGNVADATNLLQVLNPLWWKAQGDPDRWFS